MIVGFRDKRTERIWSRERPKGLDRQIAQKALIKMQLLHAATDLNSLRVPPGNRLEKPSGDRAGQHSIRVNDTWRLCFVWTSAGPDQVELVDYHRPR